MLLLRNQGAWSGVPTELTIGDRSWRPLRLAGEGATSRVWLAVDGGGNRAALKIGKDPSQQHRLADEAERLLLVDSPELVGVIDAGFLSAPVTSQDGVEIDTGLPYVALEWAEGDALDVKAERPSAQRLEIALVVARDVGAALDDLHR